MKKLISIPKMLDDYLEDTEQDPEEMSAYDLLNEALWVMSVYEDGEYYNDQYSWRDVLSLRKFIGYLSSLPEVK